MTEFDDLDLAEIRAHVFVGLPKEPGPVVEEPGPVIAAFARVTGRLWMRQFGVYGCPCVNESLPLLEVMHLIRGEISNSLTVYQGCYNKGVGASAGSHDRGGPVDIGQFEDRHLKTQREFGWGSQHRTRAQGFSGDHNHMFPIGCPHGSPLAMSQQRAWQNGRNGLVSNGPITGPGPKGKDTPHWKEGVRLMEEEIMAFKDDVAAEVMKRLEARIDDIAKAVWAADVIPNTFSGNAANKTVPASYAVQVLGTRTEDIGKQVLGRDYIPAPAADPKNPTWALATYERNTYLKVAALNAKLDTIINKLGA